MEEPRRGNVFADAQYVVRSDDEWLDDGAFNLPAIESRQAIRSLVGQFSVQKQASLGSSAAAR